jgi:hypothetical protein
MATVLNPAQHPRIWHREGKSLEQAGYLVDYLFAPNPFRKGLFSRLRQQFRLIKKLFQLKPDYLHLHTPELAWVAVFFKFFFRYKLIYDRHEHYPVQVLYGSERNAFTKQILSWSLKWTEQILYKMSDLVLLAEKGYLPDAPDTAVLIRNSFVRTKVDRKSESEQYFLVSGALSERNGVREACQFWEEIRARVPWQLHIYGHCQEEELINFLKAFQLRYPNEVKVYGVQHPINYSLIQEEIAHCSCGLALFPESAHLQGKIPSRFYEFIGFGKKLIISGNREWKQENFPENIFYLPEEDPFQHPQLLEWLTSSKEFTYSKAEWSWEYEERILLKAYKSLG